MNKADRMIFRLFNKLLRPPIFLVLLLIFGFILMYSMLNQCALTTKEHMQARRLRLFLRMRAQMMAQSAAKETPDKEGGDITAIKSSTQLKGRKQNKLEHDKAVNVTTESELVPTSGKIMSKEDGASNTLLQGSKSTMKNIQPLSTVTPSTRADTSFYQNWKSVGCKLPNLDPFHPSVNKHVTIVKNKKKCPNNPTYATLKDNMLTINVSNAQDVTVYFMQRNRGQYPDFYLDGDISNWVSLVDHPTAKLQRGTSGCLALKEDDPVLVQIDDEDGKVTFSPKKPCMYMDMLRLEKDGKIHHIATEQCLTIQESKNILVVKADKDCGKSAAIFNIDSEGIMWLGNNCLGKSDDVNKVILKKNCSQEDATKFKLLGTLEQDVVTEIPMRDDGAQITTMVGDQLYHQFILSVQEKDDANFKTIDQQSGWPVNIIMIMFDSQSRGNFERLMPKTLQFIKSNPTSFIMRGHSIVGDATAPQLAAILTGIGLGELPEGRRSRSNGKDLDDWPLLYKEFSQHGYVTLHSEDDPMLGAFNYALFGYNKQPTNHYARAFWLAATKKEFVKKPTSCLMNKFMHRYSLEYLDSLYHKYPNKAKFALIASSYLTHDEPDNIQYADDDIEALFHQMKSNGILNSSLVILFSDHGSRLNKFRHSIQGRLEERLPFMAITVPQWWRHQYPDIMQNLAHNSRILTSHFDLYATLRHVLSKLTEPNTNRTYGRSLFKRLDQVQRTCQQAGVEKHWCPCLEMQDLPINDAFSVTLASMVLESVNNISALISSKELKCSLIQLDQILNVWKSTPNKSVQEFSTTDETDSCGTCKPVFDKALADSIKSFTYIVQLRVKPGNAIFEGVVHNYDDILTVEPSILRIDAYYSNSPCVQEEFRFMSKMCICEANVEE